MKNSGVKQKKKIHTGHIKFDSEAGFHCHQIFFFLSLTFFFSSKVRIFHLVHLLEDDDTNFFIFSFLHLVCWQDFIPFQSMYNDKGFRSEILKGLKSVVFLYLCMNTASPTNSTYSYIIGLLQYTT